MLRYLMSVVMLALFFGLVATIPVRAQGATPAATPGVTAPTTETLLEATTASLPAGHAVVAVDRWRLPPGSAPLVLPALGGLVLATVDAGTITATAGGTDHALAAREVFVVPPDAEVTFHALGSDEAALVLVYVVPGFADIDFSDMNPTSHTVDYLISTSADALPGGSARLVLERLTLPPGSALPQEVVRPLVWTEIGEGAVGVTLEGEQLPFRWKSGAERTFRHGQYLPALQPGTRMTLRNAADDPLVLYHLTITPMASEAPSAGTASAGTPTA